jgi:IS1 family transposase
MRRPQNWGQPCPNRDCTYHNLFNRGNIKAISTYMTQSGKRRILQCNACHQSFSETRDTVFFDLRTPEEKVMMALKMLLVKVDLSGICFVLGVCEGTILKWLERACQQAERINAQLLRDVEVTEIQLDELWNFIRRKCSQAAAEGQTETLECGEDGRQWLWVSYAPECCLLLAIHVGERTLASAKQVIAQTAARVKGIPCFFSDGFSCYLNALMAFYYSIVNFPRTGKPGRPKHPVIQPHPDLVYAQLVKHKQGGRLKSIETRVLCGAQRLLQLGLSVSTSLVERFNLTLRNSLAPLVRKTNSFCKDRQQMRNRVLFFHVFYNFARPHMSLRLPLEQPQPSSGLIQLKWQHRTPAMAAGLSDRVWSFRELLTAKFEPIYSQSISQ